MLNRTALSSCLPPPPSQSPPVVSRRSPSPSSSHSSSHRRSHSHDSFTSSSSSGSHPRSDPAVPVRHRSPHTPPHLTLAHRLGMAPVASTSKRKADAYDELRARKKTRTDYPVAADKSHPHTLSIIRPPVSRPFSSTMDLAFERYRAWASAIAHHTHDEVHLPKPYLIKRPDPRRLVLFFTAPADDTFYTIWMKYRRHLPILASVSLVRGGTA
ncbi:hypothetical protein F5880DRAFT_1619575 [Lentinula raphanica]|nr:hypothetical protein F5880DRAFT_1619575 [Lentinula raphanica]